MKISRLPSFPGGLREHGATKTPRALGIPGVACVSILMACAAPQPPRARSAAPASPAPAREAKPAGEGAQSETKPVAPELEQLARSVRAIEDRGDDPGHHRLTRALRDAADALEALETDAGGGAAALRAAAEHIETSGRGSLSHADELRAALIAARDRWQQQEPGTPARDAPAPGALDAALAQLRSSAESLNASRPLGEQQRLVADGFQALANAIFLAAGHEAPFAGRQPTARSVSDVMEQARADILALGRADLSNIRELTSRAMSSMADLVAALGERDADGRRVAAIQAEARRIEHDSSGPFARAGWVERGLQNALGALDELEPCQQSLVASWREAARRSATSLPERGALPFQHAAIQDAFRSTLDALGAAVLARKSCAGESAARPPVATAEPREPR